MRAPFSPSIGSRQPLSPMQRTQRRAAAAVIVAVLVYVGSLSYAIHLIHAYHWPPKGQASVAPCRNVPAPAHTEDGYYWQNGQPHEVVASDVARPPQ